MASKTKKKAAPAKKKAVVRASGADSAQNKTVLRVLIAAVAVIGLIYALKIFQGGGDTHKDFKVQVALRFSGDDKPCGHFTAWGIAPIGKDKIVLADQENARLLTFDRDGKFLKAFGKKGGKPGEFNEPSGMTFDSRGNAYVMDTWNGAIKGFDEKGKQVLNLDLTQFKNFYGPRGLSFDGRDFLVSDTGSHRIALLTPQGTLDASWGFQGTDPGLFKGPLSAVGNGKGTYFVADTDNNRVQILDKDGKSVKQIKLGGSVWSVAVDNEDRFYVSSVADNGSIKVYDAKGGYLGNLADANGSGDPFRGAHSLTVTPDDTLLATFGSAVAMIKLPSGKP